MNEFKLTKSTELFEAALKYLPGGVNSPVRAFKAVGGTPPFIVKGKGPYIWDADGNKYIDYVASWGPLILGHADDDVVESVRKMASDGLTFGAPTEMETRLAQLVCDMHPACEKIRFVNSGTEATLSAIRLARGATQRDRIIKFAGCYHGHADSFLISAGSGALTFGVPSSPGVTKNTASDTLICTFNDKESVGKAFSENPDQVACLIVEPVIGNCGCIPPSDGFLRFLRDICTREGALLIFDEVMTGFRISPGGATELFEVIPDLVTLGKIIGGGMPVGAYGGKRELMDQISPSGPIYQAGTLSGNPIAMIAGITTLEKLSKPAVYEMLEDRSSEFARRIKEMLETEFNLNYSQTRVGSMFSLFFTEEPVLDHTITGKCDIDKFNKYFHGMLKRGIYLAPSQYEAGFISTTHTSDDFEQTLDAMYETLKELMGN